MQKHQYEKYKYLGLSIAYYRKEKGLSQSQLAELVNISRTHMSRIETADCAVSLDVVFDICDTLHINPHKLFDEDDFYIFLLDHLKMDILILLSYL